MNRGNSKKLSLGVKFGETTEETTGNDKQSGEKDECHEEQNGEDEVCVVRFQKKDPQQKGNKILGSGVVSFSQHRDSVVVYNDRQKNGNVKMFVEDDDDETASTVDMDEDEFPVSSSTRRNGTRRQRSVQFQEELVTAVYTRPRTTKEDKYYLHYDEYDYMDFKLEYRDDLLLEQQQKRGHKNSSYSNNRRRSTNYRRSPRKVSFKREVVDSVHPVMDRNQRNKILSDLFYTEEEMRTFLDEFVESLQKQSMQRQQKAVPCS